MDTRESMEQFVWKRKKHEMKIRNIPENWFSYKRIFPTLHSYILQPMFAYFNLRL